MQYFKTLPKIVYNNPITGDPLVMTNIMTRASIISSLLKNPLVFYQYNVQEGDTPEIVAFKYYGDSYRYWIVMFANQYLDPQFNWPLNYSEFGNYINDKYILTGNVISTTANTVTANTSDFEYMNGNIIGSTINVSYYFEGFQVINTSNVVSYSSNTQSNTSTLTVYDSVFSSVPQGNVTYNLITYNTIYQYQKITTQYNQSSQTTTVNTDAITQDTYNTLPALSKNTYYLSDGQVDITVTKNALTYYEWENQQNEEKRNINIINSNYVDEIERQFKKIMAVK
jgi:hypothetical protein